jgi:AraC family transcriptional regulator, positive regulator of tynA and feaB
MPVLESYSTDGVPSRSRVSYWNELLDSFGSPAALDPIDRRAFRATLHRDRFGCLDVIRTSASPASIEHTLAHVARTREPRFFIMTSLRGSLRLAALGRCIVLEEGDFALLSNMAPYRIWFEQTNHALILSMTSEVVHAHVPCAGGVCALRMDVDRGLNLTASAILQSLWAAVERRVPEDARLAVARSLLDVVGAAYATELGRDIEEPSIRDARRAQVKRHIEARLTDPALCPRSIAEALHLSPRYLRQLFELESETIPRYILRRRLEECAQRLRHRLWTNRSITEIAFGWGFVSAPHFTRVFKEHFGMTPTVYRRAQQAALQNA